MQESATLIDLVGGWHFEAPFGTQGKRGKQCERFEAHRKQTCRRVAWECGLVKLYAGNRENRVLDGCGGGVNGSGGGNLLTVEPSNGTSGLSQNFLINIAILLVLPTALHSGGPRNLVCFQHTSEKQIPGFARNDRFTYSTNL